MSATQMYVSMMMRCVAWFTSLSVVTCCVVSLTCGCRDSKERFNISVDGASSQLQPVVQQLDAYKARTGKYPLALEGLVKSGNLRAVPVCPKIGESCDLRYKTDDEQSFFWMVVAFEFEGWGYYLHYVSFEQRWQVTKYPPKFENLVSKNRDRTNRR